jgi:proton-translocating NADH-quinone oxidoreductase chain M
MLISPLIGVFLIIFSNYTEKRFLKLVGLNSSSFSFILLLIIWANFDKATSKFQFLYKFPISTTLNINFLIGVDGISLFFLFLTTLLIPICILSSWNSISFNLKEFLICFLILDFLLICVFSTIDLLLFYAFFEAVLIPMFLVIGVWGSRERKILAGYYFFLYTFLGSVVMLIAIIYVLTQVGSTDYEILLTFSFTKLEQQILWMAFFLSFSSKIPMVPVHLWLPEAHVEAPTAGSVILAGVLLKLGSYGFLRFSLTLFPYGSFFFSPFIYSILIIGIIYASFTAIRQTDFKRIVAYTSIAHMNLVVLGIFSFNVYGIQGAIFQSISHGFVASALFLCIGVVYERYKTRIVKYYGGLVLTMPLYIVIFLFFSIANIGFPGTSSFVGEFLIFVGAFQISNIITCLSAVSMVICGGYSLWLFNRIAYGNIKIQFTKFFFDLNLREFICFIPLMFGTLISGVYPAIFLQSICFSVNSLVELVFF